MQKREGLKRGDKYEEYSEDSIVNGCFNSDSDSMRFGTCTRYCVGDAGD